MGAKNNDARRPSASLRIGCLSPLQFAWSENESARPGDSGCDGGMKQRCDVISPSRKGLSERPRATCQPGRPENRGDEIGKGSTKLSNPHPKGRSSGLGRFASVFPFPVWRNSDLSGSEPQTSITAARPRRIFTAFPGVIDQPIISPALQPPVGLVAR